MPTADVPVLTGAMAAPEKKLQAEHLKKISPHGSTLLKFYLIC